MKSLLQEPPTPSYQPLADALRPTDIEHVIGQERLVGEQGSITRYLNSGNLPSIIFWGPPGSGKTTIAKLIAKALDCHTLTVSAVTSGTADLKKCFSQAQEQQLAGRNTILIVDEIHRFNRAQQDVLLPFIEDGTVTLIGATTENPSFELNAALLSRCKVLVTQSHDHEALTALARKAEEHFGKTLPLTDDARTTLCAMAEGDGRYMLNMCEELLQGDYPEDLTPETLSEAIQKRAPHYDKHQEFHYNLISALHKSLRGSDVNASLYWLARMLTGGEDPLYITRRLVRFAVEDIGLADPQALVQANAAKDAYHFLGSPEGELAIAQATIYLATAPKSNAAYHGFKHAMKTAKDSTKEAPPKHILNAPTKLMKDQGYGKGYQYDHDTKDGFSGQNYFPDNLARVDFYQPKERGFEREIVKRLNYWQKLREQKT